jgi:exodeoxyribonuclease III
MIRQFARGEGSRDCDRTRGFESETVVAAARPFERKIFMLKAPQEKFPEAAIREAGYGVIWHGQKSWNGVAIQARGAGPVESRRGLPGDPEDKHSRYIEALINGVRVGCNYLPNGNPAPGPKFDHKLRRLERLTKHALELLATAEPVVLAGLQRNPDRH